MFGVPDLGLDTGGQKAASGVERRNPTVCVGRLPAQAIGGPCPGAGYDCVMFRFLIPLTASVLTIPAFASDSQELKTAASHPMQYYVSLPKAWSGNRTWPVVMIIEAAEREFLRTLNVFEKARGDRPLILVTPLVTTNGGANYRQAAEDRSISVPGGGTLS